MPPQLPEHVVVTLLRQCFITPRCQVAQFRPQALLSSSTRAHLGSRQCQRPLHRQAAHRTQQRCVHANAANEAEPYLQTEFSRPGQDDLGVSPEAVTFAAKHNNGHERHGHGERIAVLGGGITGLASAHYLAKELPNAKITVYEGSDRLGGWLRSEYVDVEDGKVLFEQGPRTLRTSNASALVTLEIVR